MSVFIATRYFEHLPLRTNVYIELYPHISKHALILLKHGYFLLDIWHVRV